MFVDSEAMKKKLRERLSEPGYDVRNFYWDIGFCQLVARSEWFERMTLSVITLNAVWISIDTDLNSADSLLTARPIFQIAEHSFCAYFTWEWLMRFFAFRRKRDGLRDAWFVFDSFMVCMMVGETWILTTVMLLMSGGGGGMGNASSLRLLRLLRLSRMARMAKLLNSMPELLILVKGMAAGMRSVFYTLLLLGILTYVFAIAFRQLLDGTPVGREHFSSLFVSMHTLWRDGTLLDNTGTLVGLLLEQGLVYALVFYIFVLLAAFTILNMLIGVLCEVVSAVAETEKEQIAITTVKDGFLQIIARGGLDTDGDNMLSKEEFMAIVDDPQSVSLLDKVDVDVYGLMELADFIFESEDGTGEVQLTFADFMEVVLSLRGSNTATVKEVVDLRKFIKKNFTTVDKWLSKRVPTTGRSSQLMNDALRAAVGTPHTVDFDAKPSDVHVRAEVEELQRVFAAVQAKLEHFVRGLPKSPLAVHWPRSQSTEAGPPVVHRSRSGPCSLGRVSPTVFEDDFFVRNVSCESREGATKRKYTCDGKNSQCEAWAPSTSPPLSQHPGQAAPGPDKLLARFEGLRRQFVSLEQAVAAGMGDLRSARDKL